MSPFFYILQLKSPINHLKLSVVSHMQNKSITVFVLKIWKHIYELYLFFCFLIFSVHLELFSQLLMLLLDRRWVTGNLKRGSRSSRALLVKLNKHGAFMLSTPGCHQTDQSSEAAQEGAHHQWDSSDEGAEEPQHCQLFRQVKQRQLADPP